MKFRIIERESGYICIQKRVGFWPFYCWEHVKISPSIEVSREYIKNYIEYAKKQREEYEKWKKFKVIEEVAV